MANHSKKGVLITLEGIEGSGKSTLLKTISAHFEGRGQKVLTTREPGGTTIGEQIRDVLLDNDNITLHQDAELLLLFASRAQHIHQVINPALNAGYIVLCDRFTDSSYAYQGAGRGLSVQRIKQIEHWVQQGLQADLTLLFDVDAVVGLQRARGYRMPYQADRFEQEDRAFFERVRAGYLARAKAEPDRFQVIDANQPLAAIKQQLAVILAPYL